MVFKKKRKIHQSGRNRIDYLGIGRNDRLKIQKKRHHSAQSTEHWRFFLVVLFITLTIMMLAGILAEL